MFPGAIRSFSGLARCQGLQEQVEENCDVHVYTERYLTAEAQGARREPIRSHRVLASGGTMPLAVQAGLWGLLSGSALVIGAAIAYLITMRPRAIAAIMAFGSGVLISALSFDLMDEAYRSGGFTSTGLGFLTGAAVYTGANIIITKRGGEHRKRSGHAEDARQQNAEEGSGVAIAVGALLDGIPESIVIGVSLLEAAYIFGI